MDFSFVEILLIVLIGIIMLVILVPSLLFLYVYYVDRRQDQHAVLRNFPLLGKMRYILEMIGPELRQYLFNHDTAGKPFSRMDYQNVVLPAKYNSNMLGFGSKRDFDAPGFYIKNAVFPKQREEMIVDNSELIESMVYQIKEENLFDRKEERKPKKLKPWLLADEHQIVIGPHCPNPFTVKSLVGMSAMSYGSLGDRAITALSTGIGRAKGSWMNTGEGGLSEYHLKGDADLIYQIGPGLFGVRTKEGAFSWDALKEKAENPQVKAFELKLGQGAKTRGGHVDAEKVTPDIARIRHVEPYRSIDSPNRFKEFDDIPSMFDFMEQIRKVTGKPVGLKLVIGSPDAFEDIASYMKKSGKGPDFITVDGSEGGTGASFQELADSVGLPIKSAVYIVDQTLKKYGVRDRVKIIASGKLFTPDRIAVVLGMGADLVNIARAFMITVGCIMAQICHTNRCPVGVATTDPELQRALVVEEKTYRVTNYLLTLREGLFRIAAASGIESPALFNESHVYYKDEHGRVYPLKTVFASEVS